MRGEEGMTAGQLSLILLVGYVAGAVSMLMVLAFRGWRKP